MVVPRRPGERQGTVTTGMHACEGQRPGCPIEKSRGMGPGFRQDESELSLAVLAHHALGNHRVDIAVGVAELGEHLPGVLAEFRRR